MTPVEKFYISISNADKDYTDLVNQTLRSNLHKVFSRKYSTQEV